MKVHEILKEDEFDDAASPESEHAGGNLDMALSDMALQEILKIQKDPMEYYRSHGEDAARYANKIGQVLSRIDDKTLDLIGKSPSVQRAIEDNFDPESDSSHIPLEDMMTILQKVEKLHPVAELDQEPTADYDDMQRDRY